MVKQIDQVRTEISTVFPTTGTKAISALAARTWFTDMIDAMAGCAGQLDTNGVLAPISKNLTGTPSALTGFTNKVEKDLTVSTSAGTITIPTGGAGLYWAWYEFEVLTASETGLLEAWIFKNSTAQAALYGSVDVVVGAKRYPFSRGALLLLADADVVSFRPNGAGGMATTTGTNFLGTWGIFRLKKTS